MKISQLYVAHSDPSSDARGDGLVKRGKSSLIFTEDIAAEGDVNSLSHVITDRLSGFLVKSPHRNLFLPRRLSGRVY